MNTNTKRLGFRSLALIVAIAILMVGGLSITGAAAKNAIPGDALYPVKTSIEQTRLSLAQDAGERAQMRMAFAEQRLKEIAALIEEGRYQEVGKAVLAFEADIHGAILELETISRIDPARGTQIALEITEALTRYAQILSPMAASAPESVSTEVRRALDSTQIASGLELPTTGPGSDDNSNDNTNGDDSTSNSNDDSSNSNSNDDNTNSNSNDDSSNSNSNDDSSNSNSNDDSGNSNSNDDSTNSNSNDDNTNSNSNDDNTNSNSNDDSTNSNSNDDNSNSNSNDDNTNSNSNDDNSNSNGGDDGSGKGSNDNGDY